MTDGHSKRIITTRLTVAIAETEYAYEIAQANGAHADVLSSIDQAATHLTRALTKHGTRKREQPKPKPKLEAPLTEVGRAFPGRIGTALEREGIETLEAVKQMILMPGRQLRKVAGIGDTAENAIRAHFGMTPVEHGVDYRAREFAAIEAALGLRERDRRDQWVRASIRRANLTDPDAVRRMSDEQLLAKPGIGPTVLALLRERL
jgi:hypothetical protein